MPSLTGANEQLAMQALRERVGDARGPCYWRALEELVDDPALRRQLHAAWPQLSALDPALDRRGFLRLLGASIALAGLSGCTGPAPEQIVPWVRQPEGMPQSLPQFYATALQRGGDLTGVLVETHQGRPTKIEGNPKHPASLGGSDAIGQAAVLELWDPDRSQAPMHAGAEVAWDAFAAEAAAILRHFDRNGTGLHVLSGGIVSPTLAAQRERLLQRFPGARWHAYDPVDEENALQGARLAFGSPLRTRYRVDRADVIVALEADLLGDMPGHLRHARDFAAGRKPERAGTTGVAADQTTMSRLYAVEATPSLTGAKADHAWPLASGRIGAFAHELAVALGVESGTNAAPSGISARRVQALADDLRAHRGASLVVAGRSQPGWVHGLTHRINDALGNVGQTVESFAWPEAAAVPDESLHALTIAMHAGEVDTLLILDGNPAYSAPVDLAFGQALKKVPRSVHLGLYRNETARRCTWHLPATHALEAWSDLRAFDGTASIVQPVITPLYGGRSTHEVLALVAGEETTEGRRIVRNTWRALDDAAWETALRTGVIADSAPTARETSTNEGEGAGEVTTRGGSGHGRDASASPSVAAMAAPTGRASTVGAAAGQSVDSDAIELLFRPDPTIWDGRYANSGWLQELPKPLSMLVWSNAALISPALAAGHGLRNGDVVLLRTNDRHVEAPVWIVPGQAARSVTLPLGYGRRAAGRVGDGLGFDAYALRGSASPWLIAGAKLLPAGRRVELVSTQQHHSMEGRAPVKAATLAQFLADPAFAQSGEPAPQSLYPDRPDVDDHKGPYAWGMSVDLNACIGCGACTSACQAENNIPVVGAEEVERGREMHWIRVDRYYEGEAASPRTLHQPVPCMHCEHAPCEVVCPVGATVHDSEGLNLQVYNRCVGTRFCSNNCPYKVRRFNFLQYSDLETESLKSLYNPDVTVRNRGVMEKCTYCIQRIETAHIAADRDDRRIGDGEIVTACQAACPTRAITFGNIADPDSAVSREKASKRNYTLLEELNTRPRTTYLAALRNPNPTLGDDA